MKCIFPIECVRMIQPIKINCDILKTLKVTNAPIQVNYYYRKSTFNILKLIQTKKNHINAKNSKLYF